jgi:tRNA-dihydrouridine synthase B
MDNLVDNSLTLGLPKTLKIGTVIVNRPLVLAPMAGVTDRWYRRIMAQHGAGLVTTEMISAEGLVRRNRTTLNMLAPDPALQAPLAVQLFGARPLSMAEAARIAEQSGAAIIDINAGCPVRKVTRQGAGATLMTQLELLYLLVEATKNAVSVPVTVKFRLGWDGSSINVLETAKRVVDAGVDAITIHARTAVQGYSGKSDWAWIQRLKATISVPVIGNGDVTHPELVHRMLKDTGCDAVMIGRGSLGNPWIFGAGQMTSEHAGKTGDCLDWADFSTILQLHLEGLLRDRPNHSAGALRKVIGWYLHGCPGAARLRQQLMELSSWQEMLELCRSAVTGWQARGLSLASIKLGSPIQHEIHERAGAGPDRTCQGKQLNDSPFDALVC